MGASEAVLNQLSRPQRLVVRILKERWDEVSSNCPDRDGSRCTLSGEACEFQNCVKLAEKGRKGGDRHGGR